MDRRKFFVLGEVAKLLVIKPHKITYALTSGHVPEPEMRLGNKRVFATEDVERIARHLRVAMPQDDLIEPEEPKLAPGVEHSGGMTLVTPFYVERAGTTGHEVRDGDGAVYCWTADRAKALVIAGLLESACR
jgi:hypothetical protein